MVITYNNWCKPQDHVCHFFCNHSSHIMLLDCFLRWMARNVGVSLTYFSNESDKMFFPSPIFWVKVTGNSFPSWHIFVVAKLQVTGHFPLAYILSVGDIFPLAYLSEGYSKNTFVSPDLFFWVKMIWNPFSNNLFLWFLLVFLTNVSKITYFMSEGDRKYLFPLAYFWNEGDMKHLSPWHIFWVNNYIVRSYRDVIVVTNTVTMRTNKVWSIAMY